MPYDVLPDLGEVVMVEWLDITAHGSNPQLSRRWTFGQLLAEDATIEGLQCVVLGRTWDEDGWSDFDTFPSSVVVSITRKDD